MMASRKREQKTELQVAREATLASITAFQEEDSVLPAVIRYARDLLGAHPNDKDTVAEFTNVRAGKCHVKLRFPDGELREVRFNLTDIPERHFDTISIDLDPISEEMEEDLLAEVEDIQPIETTASNVTPGEKKETVGRVKKPTKSVVTGKVAPTRQATKSVVASKVKQIPMAAKKTEKSTGIEKRRLTRQEKSDPEIQVLPGPSGINVVPDAVKAYVDSQLSVVSTELDTARKENEALKIRLQNLDELREKERLEFQEQLNLERHHMELADARERERINRMQQDFNNELAEARRERDERRDRQPERPSQRGSRVSTPNSLDQANDKTDLTPATSPLQDRSTEKVNIPETLNNEGNLDQGANEKETGKDYETEEKGLVMKALGQIVDRLEKSNETANVRDGGLIEKDGTKFEYFLTTKKNNYNTWYSLFQTEINLKRLDDIIDETVTPHRAFSGTEIISRKKIVRGIILAHIDEIYQEQVLDMVEPIQMLQKLHKLKREEINDTTVSIKDQFRQLTFRFGHETVYDFNLRFDDLVRKYQVVAGEPMHELDKRDAYYHIQ